MSRRMAEADRRREVRRGLRTPWIALAIVAGAIVAGAGRAAEALEPPSAPPSPSLPPADSETKAGPGPAEASPPADSAPGDSAVETEAEPGSVEPLPPGDSAPGDSAGRTEPVPVQAPPPAGSPPADSPLATDADPVEAPAPELVAPDFDTAWRKARREGVSWDLQVELGGPLWASGWGDTAETYGEDLWDVVRFAHPDYSAFARVRVGFLVLREPFYFSAGPTVTYGAYGTWSFGAQADLTSTWGGIWGQGEVAYNVEHGLLVALAAGYRIFGAELRLSDGGREVALLAKVRIPIGLVVFTREYLDRR